MAGRGQVKQAIMISLGPESEVGQDMLAALGPCQTIKDLQKFIAVVRRRTCCTVGPTDLWRPRQ